MITEISPANTFFRPVFLGKNNKFSGKSKHFEQPNNFFPERKEIKKTYNELWEELKLPRNLKPPLQFRAMLSEMGFSINEYMIFVNKNKSPLKMRIQNKSGLSKFLLAHEIEHVKQIWEIIRLLGAENFIKEFNTDNDDFKNVKKYKLIEKTLGKISPNTPEGKEALSYWEALKKYTNVEKAYKLFSIQEFIDFFKYKNNNLEKNACNASKKYKPDKTRFFKTALNEYLKLLKHL